MQSVHKGMESLQEAISAYEAEMRPRTGQEVQITLKAAHCAHDWELLTQSPIFKFGANRPEVGK